jgi:Secretion system C-terminal sorting domain
MKIIAGILIALLSINAFGQIPNSDFEYWDIRNGIEEPVDWITNNEINSISVSKTTDGYEGDFALHIINNGPSFEGPLPGYASVIYTSGIIPTEISAYVKCDSVSGTGKGIISVISYLEGMESEIGKWETMDEIPQFTLVLIPLNPVGHYDSIAIRLEAFAGMDVLGWPTGHASLKVDHLRDGSESDLNEFSRSSSLKVFPNPCHDIVNISNPEGTISECAIINACGKVLYKKSFGGSDIRLDIKDYQQGLYLLWSMDNKGIIWKNKIIIK